MDKQEFARQRERGVSQAKGDAGRGLEAEVYGRWREQQDADVVDFGRYGSEASDEAGAVAVSTPRWPRWDGEQSGGQRNDWKTTQREAYDSFCPSHPTGALSWLPPFRQDPHRGFQNRVTPGALSVRGGKKKKHLLTFASSFNVVSP